MLPQLPVVFLKSAVSQAHFFVFCFLTLFFPSMGWFCEAGVFGKIECHFALLIISYKNYD